MGIETQIVVTSIAAMIGIIGVPAYLVWWCWRKCGQALEEKRQQNQH